MSFSKRLGSDAVCYTKPLDSLKNWNDHFFWVDAFACPASFPWNTSKGVPKDPFPKSSEFNAEHYATLVALLAPFHKYPKPFLCLVGISRYYTLDEDAYPEFLGDNDEGGNGFTRFYSDRGSYQSKGCREAAELEASVDRLFDEGASGDGQDVDVQPVTVTTDTIVEDVAPLQPRRQRKRKITVADAGGPSHPLKKLREDFRALGGVSTADKSHADFVPGPNLRTIGAPQRFTISSDSSHHSGANITKAKVDSIIRSSALAIETVTIVTAAIDTEATTTRAPVAPSLFGVGLSSTGRNDSVPGGFSDVSGSDFFIGGIHTVVDPDSDLQKVYMDHDQLFTEFNVGSARQISLNAEVRMRAEYNIREKRKLRAEAAEAIRFQARSLNLNLLSNLSEVHELETSSAGLQEKVIAYKGFVSQLKKFQDEKLEEVNEKFDKLCADYVEMALHLEEKFYLHLLTTISGCRWLLTYGMKLVVAKCLNSTEYLSALGAAISKAVEKGIQEGLSAGITHGAEGRQLADVTAYNLSAKADYLSALQHLQSVNFSLITELKSNKDASVDTIKNLLHLDDVLAKRLGLTGSQPHVDQLMVPIHHSPDQRVVGASALTFSLEVSNSRVKKIRENISNHVSALRGVFVPLSKPLSAMALEGMEGTSGSTPGVATTLSTTFVSASTIPPISTDDYEVAHADGQGGARVDDETVADDDMNLFVSNTDLNVSE
uniref:Transposase (Putative), gypsy type n=1 Tax=Tanacetum cinerariifolium TaxID=118510 RepID=A0A699H8S1_TANCI|nr:hypothetical protein [Tanacetum cinerariifolium]